MRCRTAIVGTILTVALSLIASPLAAQQVVELPAEDRLLDADFEEVYRVGAVTGEDWETFGNVHDLAFDADRHALRRTRRRESVHTAV